MRGGVQWPRKGKVILNVADQAGHAVSDVLPKQLHISKGMGCAVAYRQRRITLPLAHFSDAPDSTLARVKQYGEMADRSQV